MEGDSAVRGYRDAQINRFESQREFCNQFVNEVLNGKVRPRITCNFLARGGRADR